MGTAAGLFGQAGSISIIIKLLRTKDQRVEQVINILPAYM